MAPKVLHHSKKRAKGANKLLTRFFEGAKSEKKFPKKINITIPKKMPKAAKKLQKKI